MGRPNPRLVIPWLRAITLFLNGGLFIVGWLCTFVSVVLATELLVHPDPDTPTIITTERFAWSPFVLLFMGAYIVLVTGMGFICLRRMLPKLIYTYIMLLVALFFMELGTAFAMICYWKAWPQALEDGLTRIINNYDPHSIHMGLTIIHFTFHCCGVHNYTDWQRADRAIPMTCCADHESCIVSDHNNLFQTGCYDAITEGLDRHWCAIITYCLLMMLLTLLAASIAGLSLYLAANRVLERNHNPVVVHVSHHNTDPTPNELI